MDCGGNSFVNVTARKDGTIHTVLADADDYDQTCDGWEAAAGLDAELAPRIGSALAAKRNGPGSADGVMGGRTGAAIEAFHSRPGLVARLSVSPPFVRTAQIASSRHVLRLRSDNIQQPSGCHVQPMGQTGPRALRRADTLHRRLQARLPWTKPGFTGLASITPCS